MIYRIAIYKNGKFVRYATQEERYWLRINSSGLVQKVKNGLSQLFRGWFDVSKTHKVEWGMLTSDKNSKLIPIYEGDIYIDWNTGIVSKPTKPEVFDLFRDYNNLHPDQFPMIEIIGNVHQNPELLEAK